MMTWKCLECNIEDHGDGSIYCSACYQRVGTPRAYRLRWIEELRAKVSAMTPDGWPIGTSEVIKRGLLLMWPNYTPCKEAKNKIAELLTDIGERTPCPYPNLSPCGAKEGIAFADFLGSNPAPACSIQV
jgi:hypothetical protein